MYVSKTSGSIHYGEMEKEALNQHNLVSNVNPDDLIEIDEEIQILVENDNEEYIMVMKPPRAVDEAPTYMKVKKQQINSDQEKKKWNPNILAMIDSQSYHTDKISFSSSQFQTTMMLTPFYQYSLKIQEPLHIQTKFFDLEKNSIMYKEFKKFHDDNRGFIMKIAPELFDFTTLNMLLDYDRQVKKFINNQNIKCIEKLIYNKEIKKHELEFQNDPIPQLDYGPIKFKLSKKLSKVMNYNISKKYPKVEEFNGTKNKLSDFFDIFDRILSDKKQVRFVFSPMTWIRDNKYGSHIMIHNMEIKFKDAKISSVLDTESKTMHEEITSITI
ncbi:hypothetical protein Klosneuvirus_1_351 [Klosneuvirus KNV1]|uniref:Uncharacterized protein n=1 Tax=Klosneuvirus KNV1 TaxID=1977640 RepID=A0A1V0SIM5_9VIRU|nr:hypothetical protein Klosneuvirus_1_351 [Klosneuvirus KNV1]